MSTVSEDDAYRHERLKREYAELDGKYADLKTQFEQVMEANKQLASKLEVARKAILKLGDFAGHLDECACFSGEGDCECGLKGALLLRHEALAAIQEPSK